MNQGGGEDEKRVTKVVTPDQYRDEMQPIFESVRPRLGLVALLDERACLSAKGTAVFTKVGEQFLVLTARHVVRVEADNDNSLQRTFTPLRVRLMVFPRTGGIKASVIPIGFDLTEADICWEDWRLDVIAFRAPTSLTASGLCHFEDGDSDAKIAAKVRERCAVQNDEQNSLATFVIGFPNITHHVDEATKLESLGLLPLPAYVTAIESHVWNGQGDQAPQFIMELDPSEVVSDGDGELLVDAANWRATLLKSVEAGARPPLGGFSGAPVFIAHQHGVSLVGLMKEGASSFGVRVTAIGSCWDDIVACLRRGQSVP